MNPHTSVTGGLDKGLLSRSSLRWKVMGLLAAMSSLTAVVVGAVSYESMQHRLRDEIDSSLIQATDRFLDGPNVGRRFRPGGPTTITVPERPLGIEQYVVQVADSGGEVLAATAGVTLPVNAEGVDAIAQNSDTFRTVTSAEGDRYRVRSVVVNLPGLRTLVVQLGRDLSETDRVLADLRLRIVVIGVIVALIAALVGAVFSTGVTSRLRRLSRAAEEVAATGELEIDVPDKGGDETALLARTFREMIGALKHARAQQQRLVQDAGHELRTPLTSVRTNIDVLKRHKELPQAMRDQILSDLERDSVELAELIDEIVSVAAQTDVSSAAKEPFDLVDLGDLATTVAERFTRRMGRTIVVRSDGSRVMGRAQMLERALSNLVDNALKFDSGTDPVEIEIESGTVTVRDRGPGIPQGELSLIFERFHRSAEARSLPGSGLGLSIVADVAAEHGGEHFARPRVGGGAEVGFSVRPV